MLKEENFKIDQILDIAQKMALAARTAPKAKGIDLLEIAIASGEDIGKISQKMKEIGDRESHPTFLRDAENIKASQAIFLIGTKIKTIGLRYCSFCGYPNCAEAEKNRAICAYNTGDLGIAIGSAAAIASDFHIDNRLMYTIGKAVIDLGLLGNGVKIAYGIPLSVSGKNPFFDRMR